MSYTGQGVTCVFDKSLHNGDKDHIVISVIQYFSDFVGEYFETEWLLNETVASSFQNLPSLTVQTVTAG